MTDTDKYILVTYEFGYMAILTNRGWQRFWGLHEMDPEKAVFQKLDEIYKDDTIKADSIPELVYKMTRRVEKMIVLHISLKNRTVRRVGHRHDDIIYYDDVIHYYTCSKIDDQERENKQLKSEIELLKKKMEEYEIALYYQPGGNGEAECKIHFESFIQKD